MNGSFHRQVTQGDVRMFKIIGGVLVYGFALYGLSTFLSKNDWVEADND